ncbi:hypothetical protein SALBM311S_08769 [Streptomyces alboniger]
MVQLGTATARGGLPRGHGPGDDHAGTRGAARRRIAWVVGTPWQGHGFASEAARALVEWLGGRPVRTVVAHIHPEHLASASVALAAGLTPTEEEQDGERRWRRILGDTP